MTTNDTRPLCTVCKRSKYTLKPRKSKLIPGMQMLLCNECYDESREPRFAVILVARDPNRGLGTVRDYIVKRKYYGPKITADELV